jgi:hypothetical protein
MSNPQRLSTEKPQVVTQNQPRASAEGMQVVPDDSPEVFQKYDPSPELVPQDGQEEKILADVEERQDSKDSKRRFLNARIGRTRFIWVVIIITIFVVGTVLGGVVVKTINSRAQHALSSSTQTT